MKAEMRVSKAGFALIEKWEGRVYKPYRCPGGYLTIGVGHKMTPSELHSGYVIIDGRKVRYAGGLTDAMIDDLLAQDVLGPEDTLNFWAEAPLTQNQFDALASFIFNVGDAAFINSTLLKRLNDHQYDEVPAQLRRWVYSNGRKLRGLAGRREDEIALWNTP